MMAPDDWRRLFADGLRRPLPKKASAYAKRHTTTGVCMCDHCIAWRATRGVKWGHA